MKHEILFYRAIVAMADMFKAMTSTRPCRRTLSRVEAIEELKNGTENQFHPDLVKAFVSVRQGVEGRSYTPIWGR